ncbi:MAG: hypothetical protein AB1424_00950 [Thermodesulfobacteriota bacterium]
MKTVMDMDEELIRGRSWGDPAWAVQQILYLKGQLKLAQAAINDLALPRIAQLEKELVSLQDELAAAFSTPSR